MRSRSPTPSHVSRRYSGETTLLRRGCRATWHVDVYGGILQGVVIAEIELKQESQEVILPRWIGKEVTGDSFYKKINMRARALTAHRHGR